ncbi:hypothetical protein N7474_003726 [Penicillium riverlandense]|uniref:uncharacterized protein n=1 Tax=Penicillium riverlandense TaxID=1903569 RepID=UPI0025489E11|nr:uncharacterized protein N7474_003726 [Penicillium riverlandense]KAJ5818135.1 hypothetical protein N7474_003726 [Penicillium riverlandense]
MSESSSLLQPEPESRRSLRDRIVDAFRQTGSSTPPPEESVGDGTRSSHRRTPPVGNSREPDARTRLLDSYYRQEDPVCGSKRCSHGTFSPRIEDGERQSWPGSSGLRFEHGIGDGGEGSGPDDRPDSENLSQMKSSLSALSMNDQKKLYFSYYIPFFTWIGQYRWSFIRGDFIAALTIASIYIPMALSLASNLAHAPPINGLYSFVINPLVYALLGSCPLLVVGPEAAGSLLTGAIVKASISQGHSGEDDSMASAMVVGVATSMAGAMILVAGLTRLGFLDNVLSRPFLRGFITAIGFVIFVDQLIPELGLADPAQESGASHGTTAQKLVFIVQNIRDSHALTAAVSVVSFVVIMIFRTLKKWLMPRYPQVIYFPDRFLVVVLSAILAWKLDWEDKGLELLGHTEISSSRLFVFQWPFQFAHMKHVRTAMSKAFIIALLGFFESSIAAKGLGDGCPDGIKGMNISANREMVALGVANVVGGCFMALPAFGGYGRSRVNQQTGARSPMSNVFLSAITLVCIFVLLPYLYYLPKPVLCSMISVVAFTLVEECPSDIKFFFRLRGWTELSLMLLIFLTTIFYSLELGMAFGIGLSVIILIRHSTKPRIQILGKVPGTARFENAELRPENIELVEGALVVKIPEPLTFANTGDLKNRLRRLELYGSSRAHPSLPRMRPAENNRNIVFDVHGVTSIDGSGTQVLWEIVRTYTENGTKVYFCRLPNAEVFSMFERSGIVEQCGGLLHFVPSVDEALRLAETEEHIHEI